MTGPSNESVDVCKQTRNVEQLETKNLPTGIEPAKNVTNPGKSCKKAASQFKNDGCHDFSFWHSNVIQFGPPQTWRMP